jgi:UDP-N-acetylmuramoylalanine--D-glutamate ligase
LSPSLRPQAAILLNITPDHLDRHGGMAGYVAVKRKLFANQQAGDMAVIGIDDDHCAAICNELAASSAATVVPLSVERAVEGGIYVKDGILFDTRKGHLERIGDLSEAPALKGSHNWQNAAAAYAVASRFVADRARLFGAICSFPGLAHRMEAVGTWEGVAFINDSKATNQASAARALASFEHIHWIAGGIAKEDNLNAVIPFLPRMEKAYLIGRAAPVFEAALKGLLPVVQCGDMLTAMQAAAEDAVKAGGGTVLLSPAAASQDQFRDYEERGDVFRAAARQWIEERKKG